MAFKYPRLCVQIISTQISTMMANAGLPSGTSWRWRRWSGGKIGRTQGNNKDKDWPDSPSSKQQLPRLINGQTFDLGCALSDFWIKSLSLYSYIFEPAASKPNDIQKLFSHRVFRICHCSNTQKLLCVYQYISRVDDFYPRRKTWDMNR